MMKFPRIRRATWEKDIHPEARWVVVERKYNTYDTCSSLINAIRYWMWHMGLSPKIAFYKMKKK